MRFGERSACGLTWAYLMRCAGLLAAGPAVGTTARASAAAALRCIADRLRHRADISGASREVGLSLRWQRRRVILESEGVAAFWMPPADRVPLGEPLALSDLTDDHFAFGPG
jgi:hypothetical protein